MAIDRFYLKDPLKEQTTVFLQAEEFHHFNHVMRKKEHDVVELVNGEGMVATARVLTIGKKGASLSILKTSFYKPKLAPLTLIQALPKLSSLEWIIQKGTELGTTLFYLFPSERSEKKGLSEHQKKRLLQIAINAMKQCGRFDLPSFEYSPSLKSLSLPAKGNALFGDPHSKNSLSQGFIPDSIFIGPEKGFSKNECQILEETFEAKGVCFHPYTLRVETAAIAALTLATSHPN